METAPVCDGCDKTPEFNKALDGTWLHGEVLTVEPEHREFFKLADNDAICHLAYEAKRAKNEKVIEQLRVVNNEFFDIGLNRVDVKEETNENPTA
jgi:hypothetical protein